MLPNISTETITISDTGIYINPFKNGGWHCKRTEFHELDELHKILFIINIDGNI